ncbi:MAG: hypothetical protein R2849_14580 [Thermomicrobiales bacterium]
MLDAADQDEQPAKEEDRRPLDLVDDVVDVHFADKQQSCCPGQRDGRRLQVERPVEQESDHCQSKDDQALAQQR